jgi:hypothetical protein
MGGERKFAMVALSLRAYEKADIRFLWLSELKWLAFHGTIARSSYLYARFPRVESLVI